MEGREDILAKRESNFNLKFGFKIIEQTCKYPKTNNYEQFPRLDESFILMSVNSVYAIH